MVGLSNVRVFTLAFLMWGLIWAQVASKLSQKDVDNILKILPEIAAKIDELNVNSRDEDEIRALVLSLQTHQQVMNLFPKYGMSFTAFIEKFQAVMDIYVFHMTGMAEEEFKENMSEALRELENNPYLTPEQRKQMKQNLVQTCEQLKSMKETIKEKYHPDDILLVKKNMEKIQQTLESLNK